MDENQSKAVCTLCVTAISRGTGNQCNYTTTALNNHLKFKHNEKYKETLAKRSSSPVAIPMKAKESM